jgi:hypothetical protein
MGAAATLLGVLAVAALARDPEKLPFSVIAQDNKGNHWVPSGYMGSGSPLKLDDKCSVKPHAGKVCTKVDYPAGEKWAGVFFQDPPNDWKDEKLGGFNLTGAKKFVVWARGEKGGERVTFGYGNDKSEGKYTNTSKGETKVELTTDWKAYEIDLAGKDLTLVKNGFFISAESGDAMTFYVSEVHFE